MAHSSSFESILTFLFFVFVGFFITVLIYIYCSVYVMKSRQIINSKIFKKDDDSPLTKNLYRNCWALWFVAIMSPIPVYGFNVHWELVTALLSIMALANYCYLWVKLGRNGIALLATFLALVCTAIVVIFSFLNFLMNIWTRISYGGYQGQIPYLPLTPL